MSKWMIVLAALLLPVSVRAQMHALPAAPHLLVRGHAQGHYVPDRFTIHVTVRATDMHPDTARRRVEKHMEAIFAALKRDGALRDKTYASSLSMRPVTVNSYKENKFKFKGTRVQRTVEATFATLTKLRRFIAQLPASKEVRVQHTDTSRSDADKINLKLRQRAIANSKAAARKIAHAYGLQLAGVYSVSDVAPNFAYGIQAGRWRSGSRTYPTPAPAPPAPPAPPSHASSTVGPDLRAGTIALEQDIYVVYLTKPAS